MASNDGTVEDPTEGGTSEDENGVVRALRESNQRESDRATQAERKLAMYEAGLPGDKLGTKVGQAFLSSYEGEMTPEAIRAEAEEWGLLGGTPAPVDDGPELTPEEQRLDQLRGAGGTPAPVVENAPKDPNDEGFEAWHAARARGAPAKEAFRDGITPKILAVAAGQTGKGLTFEGWDESELPRKER